jgi:hypothetical protein
MTSMLCETMAEAPRLNSAKPKSQPEQGGAEIGRYEKVDSWNVNVLLCVWSKVLI